MSLPYPLVFSTLGTPDWSLERAIAQAVADGYAGLEVRILDGQVIPPDLPKARRGEIRRLLQQHERIIAGIGASTRFSSPDPDERAKHLADLQSYLALANDLNVPIVRTFGGNQTANQTMQEVIDHVANSLAEVMPAAERHGVTVCLETHDAFCRGEEVAAVLQQVDSPHLKAIWDVHHPYRMGESIEDTWKFIGERLAHVHVKDARPREDGSWQLVLLGEGQVPCREIIHLLAAKGYQGYLCAEWEKKWHPEIQEPDIALPQHAQALRHWMAEIPNDE